MKKQLNLNHESLYIEDFDFGKTQNVEIKIGRKTMMLDVDKNSLYTSIDVYDKLNKQRTNYSKYSANLHYATVKNNAILNREFFERIAEIEQAQRIVKRYNLDLYMI